MRSHAKTPRVALIAAFVALSGIALCSRAQAPDDAAPNSTASAPGEPVRAGAGAAAAISPTPAEVKRALENVRKDPNLGVPKEVRRLKWVEDDKPRPPRNLGAWAWLADLARWMAETSRILIYVIAALAAIAFVLYLTRFLGGREPRAAKRRVIAPTHVRDLDIRPESLPDDIGAAALELWSSNEHRGALSLLYRGLLSRLAHVHAVPIRASTTEGDCLALAEKHLSADRAAYVSRLVKVWQRAVYGSRDPDTQTVTELCEGFALALNPSSQPFQAQPA